MRYINLRLTYLLTYLTLSIIMTLKCGLEVTQGHGKWYHLKALVLKIRPWLL